MTGLHTHMCVRHTSADAFCLGYDVVVAKEATDSFTEEDYLNGLAYLKTCYGADAYTNEELIAAFWEVDLHVANHGESSMGPYLMAVVAKWMKEDKQNQ